MQTKTGSRDVSASRGRKRKAKEEKEPEQKNCHICMAPLVQPVAHRTRRQLPLAQQVARVTELGCCEPRDGGPAHKLHASCFETWLRAHQPPKCPMCNTRITMVEMDPEELSARARAAEMAAMKPEERAARLAVNAAREAVNTTVDVLIAALNSPAWGRAMRTAIMEAPRSILPSYAELAIAHAICPAVLAARLVHDAALERLRAAENAERVLTQARWAAQIAADEAELAALDTE